MNFSISKPVLAVAVMTAALFILGGCFRKHIVSTPPAQRPAQGEQATPVAKPAVVEHGKEETPEIIEETYEVDAAEETAPTAPVQEGNLDDEPNAAPAQTVIHDEKVKEAEAAAEAAAVKETETASPAPLGEMYYVQIGAFSDMDNANKVLARLIEDGYTGSRLSRTDAGLFRVQAGAFTDKATAEDALNRLLPEFPRGFILKGTPEE